MYLYDGLGSVRSLASDTGSITDTYVYQAFGDVEVQNGTTANRYLYTGEQYDPNVGFYYLRARYYNPSIGRFQTMDTYAGRMHEPATLHKYLYVHADPVNMVDPSGLYTSTFGRAVEKKSANSTPRRMFRFLNVEKDNSLATGTITHFLKVVFSNLIYLTLRNKRFAEIKPLSPSGVASGKAQIALYSAAFGAFGRWRDAPFTADSTWVPAPTNVDGRFVQFFNSQGVIFYTDDRRAHGELAALSLVALGSAVRHHCGD